MTNEEFAAKMMNELAARNADMPFEAVLNIVARASTAGPSKSSPAKMVDVWIQMHLTASLTADEWDFACDPSPMLSRVRFRHFKQEFTEFGCACCRRVRDLLPDEVFDRLIAATEQHIRGTISVVELEAVRELAGLAQNRVLADQETRQRATSLDSHRAAVWQQVRAMDAVFSLDEFGYYAATNASLNAVEARAKAAIGPEYETERAAQADLLRELLGNPLRETGS